MFFAKFARIIFVNEISWVKVFKNNRYKIIYIEGFGNRRKKVRYIL